LTLTIAFAAALGFVFANTAVRGAEIKGTVRDVGGGTVTVLVEGDLVPSVGDKADIYFKLAGGDDEIAVATGTVTGEEAGAVKVKIGDASGEVAKDHLARFSSANPKPRQRSRNRRRRPRKRARVWIRASRSST